MTGTASDIGDRIGASERLRPGDAAGLATVATQLRALCLRRLRLSMRADEEGWNAEQLRVLGRDAEILPALHGLPDEPAAAVACVARLLDRSADLALIELPVSTTEPASDAIRAELGRRGVRLSLQATLAELRDHALRDCDAVTLLGTDGVSGDAGAWTDVAEQARAALPNAEFWLVAGHSTWRHDPYRQLVAFRDAVAAPFARIYWHALRDDGESRDDPRLDHRGLYTATGEPKLLARLLAEGGMPAVDKVIALGLPAPALATTRPVLVTGGAGFIGSNLADKLASDGHDVLVFDALARPGVDANLAWLRRRHPRRVSVAIADLRDRHAIRDVVARTPAVFHLAAQVAVTTSMVDPNGDFDINLRGTLNLIDALRQAPDRAPLIFASTNKVYGDLADVVLDDLDGAYLPVDAELHAHGIGEDRPLQFHTPYGCSKGGADQYVLDTARSFDVPSAVLRMSCIYGPRQMGTEDQGWLAHFLISVLDGKPITIYGDGRQVRDALYVDDAVTAYLAAWRDIGTISGQAFNLGGGSANAVTLRGVIAEIERLTNRRADVSYADWRPGDQRYFVADARRITAALGLPRPVGWRDGLARLSRWLSDQRYAAPSRDVRQELAMGEGA